MVLTTDPVVDTPLGAVVGLQVGPRLRLLAVTTAGQPPARAATPVRRRPTLGSPFGDLHATATGPTTRVRSSTSSIASTS